MSHISPVRQDLVKNTPEIFFREVKLFQGEAPPIFVLQISLLFLPDS